jgi:phospholipase/carboxylesterase
MQRPIMRSFYCAAAAILAALFASAACDRESRLTTIVSGGDGPPTLVLLHGYGSSAEQWLPFTQTIRLAPGGRFVFPQAPERMSRTDGPATGRAWWRLALASHIPPGGTLPDLSAARPSGLSAAAALVEDLLEDVERFPGRPIFLGGYSQGAMVASELAFRTDARIDALVLLSGTLVDEASWEREFAKRTSLPVFMSHGRSDPVLPFAIADRFRVKLQTAGVRVTWVPFDGGHEVPAAVVGRLNAFLAELRPTR